MEKGMRKNHIDLLKGIAILAVLLYHFGILKSGYLGVDVFFVIAGFLTVPSILKKQEDGCYSYWKYLKNKLLRLLPLLLIASAVSLIIGFFFWLPDDYENLSESIIATTFFSNNILAGITTGNYWDTVNDYKPFMHTWYLGILMEFYILIPLLMKIGQWIARKKSKSAKNAIAVLLAGFSLLSLLFFLLPQFKAGDKFYYLPFRFFELGIGGIVGLYATELKEKIHAKKIVSYILLFLLTLTLCVGVFTLDLSKIGVETAIIGGGAAKNELLLPNSVLILLTVLLSAALLILLDGSVQIGAKNPLCLLGKRSFSIFVWHQVLLALYRYSITPKITPAFLLYLLATALLSEVSYRQIEQRVRDTRKSWIAIISSAVLLCGVCGIIYLNAGVVRDIPELGISADNVHRRMHAEYCDRLYEYDSGFEDNGKLNVLVIGNSFARDFGNILLESDSEVNLSYCASIKGTPMDRIQNADRIFLFEDKENVPAYIFENCARVYAIGTKNFGPNNGNIYARRFMESYFSQSVALDEGYRALNESWKEAWGDRYIDMIAPVTLPDGSIRVFTDDHAFISQDCRHLTQAGAQYYAERLDLEGLLN